MEVNISDLTWSKFIYPRGGKSEKTVEAYVEALGLGAQFPPIKIQRVLNYEEKRGNENTEATLILDGIHRFLAFDRSGIKKIAAVEWKNEPLDYEKNKIALLLESAEPPSISSYSKEEYENFLKSFFRLARKSSKRSTRLAFLNADWIDFESTPAMNVDPDKCITSFDYHRLLADSGWKVCYRIDCPFSSERLN